MTSPVRGPPARPWSALRLALRPGLGSSQTAARGRGCLSLRDLARAGTRRQGLSTVQPAGACPCSAGGAFTESWHGGARSATSWSALRGSWGWVAGDRVRERPGQRCAEVTPHGGLGQRPVLGPRRLAFGRDSGWEEDVAEMVRALRVRAPRGRRPRTAVSPLRPRPVGGRTAGAGAVGTGGGAGADAPCAPADAPSSPPPPEAEAGASPDSFQPGAVASGAAPLACLCAVSVRTRGAWGRRRCRRERSPRQQRRLPASLPLGRALPSGSCWRRVCRLQCSRRRGLPGQRGDACEGPGSWRPSAAAHQGARAPRDSGSWLSAGSTRSRAPTASPERCRRLTAGGSRDGPGDQRGVGHQRSAVPCPPRGVAPSRSPGARNAYRSRPAQAHPGPWGGACVAGHSQAHPFVLQRRHRAPRGQVGVQRAPGGSPEGEHTGAPSKAQGSVGLL